MKPGVSQDTCPHREESVRIFTRPGTSCTCEATVIKCTDCGKILHEELDC